jgi:mono/diheme cytochrome c family protein
LITRSFPVLAAFGAWMTLSLGAVQAQQPAGGGKSVWDGVYTAQQAKRGSALYAEHCAYCHGSGLGGGDVAPALTGVEFAGNWSGLTLGDLFERIRISMPQDDPGKLSAQQKADTLAYILNVGMFPSGMTELSHETPVLAQIKFEATKP